MTKTIREKYYFCEGCRKFHSFSNHAEVNKKLCFFCESIKPTTRKTKNEYGEFTQICSECRRDYLVCNECRKEYFEEQK